MDENNIIFENENEQNSDSIVTSEQPTKSSVKSVPKERITVRKVLGDCDIQSVTVYLDKAEVCRFVPISLDEDQITEILFTQLPPFIDRESIRIEARGAPVIIQDVTFQTIVDAESSDTDMEIQATDTTIKDILREKDSLIAKYRRLSKQRAVLENFADILVKGQDNDKPTDSPTDNVETVASPKSAFGDSFDPKLMITLNGFLDVYEKQAEKLDEQILNTKDELGKADENLQNAERKKQELEEIKEKQQTRELSVYVEAKEKVKSELGLYYVVNQCSWKPSYDIRVINSESKMKITYYAVVQQNSTEDWNDMQEFYVSTSQPPIGGSVPDIGIQKIYFRTNSDGKSNQLTLRHPTKIQKSQRMSKALSFQERNDKGTVISGEKAVASKLAAREPFQCYSDDNMPIKENSDDVISAPRSKSSTLERQETIQKDQPQSTPTGTIRSAKTPSKSDTPTAFYAVPRPPQSIPSGGDSQKVIIGYLDLTPNFEYVSVPKRSPYAYLKASSTNTSEYAVLTGEANVFIDNNFIGKTELKTVAPGEDFTCHLGADHRIQISYHPMYKYREGSAPITKTMCLTFKQIIEVTNNYPRPIKLTLMDHLPVANEDKIKINLQEPNIKHPEKYDKSKPVRIARNSQVEWDLEIGNAEKKELTLKYTVEYPAAECLDLITE